MANLPAVSPIVTRGFSTNQRIITRGYGFAFIPIVAEVVRATFGGTKRRLKEYHEELQEFTVTAMIIAINGADILNPKLGKTSGEITNLDVKISATFKTINRLGYLTERIIINAFRVIRRGFKKIED